MLNKVKQYKRETRKVKGRSGKTKDKIKIDRGDQRGSKTHRSGGRKNMKPERG